MSSGYSFMIIGLLAFAGMGILHKLGDRLHGHPRHIAVLTMAFAAVATLARSLITHSSLLSMPKHVALLALPFGICAAVALWLFQSGLRHGHIVTSWLLINLSNGVPTVLSVVVYREPLSLRKSLTLLLVAASLILLWWDRRNQPDGAQLKLTGTEVGE